MTLAGIIINHEDELICDLAEYYGIYDYRALPVRLLARLVDGLRDDSRIKIALVGGEMIATTHLLAGILDALHTIEWQLGGGGKRPDSIVSRLTKSRDNNKPQSYDSVDEYEAEWNRITKGGE